MPHAGPSISTSPSAIAVEIKCHGEVRRASDKVERLDRAHHTLEITERLLHSGERNSRILRSLRANVALVAICSIVLAPPTRESASPTDYESADKERGAKKTPLFPTLTRGLGIDSANRHRIRIIPAFAGNRRRVAIVPQLTDAIKKPNLTLHARCITPRDCAPPHRHTPFIPARAGAAWSGTFMVRRRPVHPRARGSGDRVCQQALLNRRSSPRARERLRVRPGDLRGLRFIPSRACERIWSLRQDGRFVGELRRVPFCYGSPAQNCVRGVDVRCQ